MKKQKKDLDLGGQGEKWSITVSIMPEFGQEGRSKKSSWYSIVFRTNKITEAKQIILSQTQKILRRFKNPKNLDVTIMGSPILETQKEQPGDGARLVRLRFKYSHGGKILGVKNPNTALVIGYGTKEAMDRLSQR